MIPVLTHSWALLLFLLLPWLAWRHLHSSRGAWQFSDSRLLPEQRGGRTWWARRGGPGLRLLGLGLAITALAGPRWPDPNVRIPTEGISIAMVVDVSVSMSEEDFVQGKTKTSRLQGVKELFRLFVAGGESTDGTILSGRPQDLIALVTFATHPETACPLTLDHKALLKILDAQQPRSSAEEGTTNPGDAIAWALHLLQRAPTKRKVLVFLTDGESNVPGKLTPRQAAQLAGNLSLPIYAIDASPETVPGMKKDEIDEVTRARESMQAIAKMTAGHYFRAQDSQGLLQAYQNIDRMERDRIESFQNPLYYEAFVWFAFAALGCWLALIVLESTWWRVLP
jgi:Ca-activated chloride channel family protein